MKSMGSLGSIMKLIPGMGKQISGEMLEQGEVQLKRCEAMINSMTREERKNPNLLSSSPSRRRRIAAGSGHQEKRFPSSLPTSPKCVPSCSKWGAVAAYPVWAAVSLAWAAVCPAWGECPVCPAWVAVCPVSVPPAAKSRKSRKRKRALANCS